MKKINYAAGALLILEGMVVVSSTWTIIRDVGRSNPLETAVVGSVFAFSVLALLALSLSFRKTAPFCALLGWLTLFGVLLLTMFFPRLGH